MYSGRRHKGYLVYFSYEQMLGIIFLSVRATKQVLKCIYVDKKKRFLILTGNPQGGLMSLIYNSQALGGMERLNVIVTLYKYKNVEIITGVVCMDYV